jgi:hypothetical protein
MILQMRMGELDQSDNVVVQGMPSIYGYGHVAIGIQCKDEQNTAQSSIDVFVGKLAFSNRGGLNDVICKPLKK